MSSGKIKASLLGCGWVGVPLAQKLITNEVEVWGSTTRPERISLLSSLGIKPCLLRLDGDSATSSELESVSSFFDTDVLVIGIPPQSALGSDFHLAQIETILAARAHSKSNRHVIYVSSLSVYGDEQGEVDETTTPTPTRDSGETLLLAENALRDAAKKSGFSLTIVRAAGLIGPGRHPGMFLKGKVLLPNPQSVVNLIHQEDLAELLSRLVSDTSHLSNHETRVFNAVARAHPTREDFYTRSSIAVGVEAPTFKHEKSESIGKRVSGDRIREITKYDFKYDDLYSSLGPGV
ncbi:MAG: SDR family oxidoreductase [Bdellovibrionota bacterium]